jgi:hypothetical protein
MSDHNPYETLGLMESASFDEIQDARNRLVEEHASDRKQVEMVEAAYDAILMDRLRMRQEGRIKVPDRIRFPEKIAPAPPAAAPAPVSKGPAWLQNLLVLDTPSRSDVLWPATLFAGLGALSLYSPGLALALGVGVSLYFLNRKEHKFFRVFLLTLVGSTLGIVLGLQLFPFLAVPLASLSIDGNAFASWVTLLLLWLISSFLR